MTPSLPEAAGRRNRRLPILALDDPRRSPATLPGYRLGQRPANAGKTYPAEVLPAREVLALLEACPRTGRHWRAGTRNRALIALLWRSGLRIEEALLAEVKDADLECGVIRVLRGKGGTQRTVPFDAGVAALLVDWLIVRGELLAQRGGDVWASPTHGPLFCIVEPPNFGRRVHDAYVRGAMKQLAEKAGLRRRVHPHALRHTFASEVYFNEGAQVSDLMLALGHAHPSTTDRYIHRIAPTQRLVELVQGRQWPAGGHAASPPSAGRLPRAA
jgi:integrase/recombinase XerC